MSKTNLIEKMNTKQKEEFKEATTGCNFDEATEVAIAEAILKGNFISFNERLDCPANCVEAERNGAETFNESTRFDQA